MATANETLMRLLAEQAGDTNLKNRFSAAVAKGQLQNLALEEDKEAYNKIIGRDDASIAAYRAAPNLYGIQGAKRVQGQELAAADLTYNRGLEDDQRQRDQQLALQDIRNKNEQSSLMGQLAGGPAGGKDMVGGTPRVNPIQNEAPASDPFTQSALLNNATIPTAAATRSQGLGAAKQQMGVDFSNPSHIAIAKSAIQDAIKTGKPVDPEAIRQTILSGVQKADQKDLESKVTMAKLKKDLAAATGTDAKSPELTPWTRSSVNVMQKDVLALTQQAGDFMRIAEAFDPEFLEVVPQLMQGYNSIKERLGVGDLAPEQSNKLARYKRFQMNVVQTFNTYRKLITGAAASEKELESLEKGFLHMKLSPTEFKAALGALQAATKSKMILLNKAQKAGPGHISVTDPQKYIDNIRDGIIEDKLDGQMAETLQTWDNFAEKSLSGKRGEELAALEGAKVSYDENGKAVIDESSIPKYSASKITPARIGAIREKYSRVELEARREQLLGSRSSSSAPAASTFSEVTARPEEESTLNKTVGGLNTQSGNMNRSAPQQEPTAGGWTMQQLDALDPAAREQVISNLRSKYGSK